MEVNHNGAQKPGTQNPVRSVLSEDPAGIRELEGDSAQSRACHYPNPQQCFIGLNKVLQNGKEEIAIFRGHGGIPTGNSINVGG